MEALICERKCSVMQIFLISGVEKISTLPLILLLVYHCYGWILGQIVCYRSEVEFKVAL